ncbi:unnamed protein product [Kuraishia capsulata CBS 1993]|uniref:Uncharacterized protein n=1 Tax=Kuraishia capsulata CBS 1993 TaxID=1382522 RepID=W6MLK6_9ASCO|nr:uncharacterized protein KUCA_T00001692001 [Kuraishia capsulata CBS 1993]CDK25722.1 unnamed protein product [Kuraishia capsulata CBS 1993]
MDFNEVNLGKFHEERIVVEDKISDLIQVNTSIVGALAKTLKSDEIQEYRKKVQAILEDLIPAVESVGVDNDYLVELVDLVLDSDNHRVFSTAVKNRVVNNVMIPRQPVTPEICLKILASISLEVYSADDTPNLIPRVQRGLPQTVQSNILKWWECLCFDLVTEKTFLKMLPLMFTYLSFAYARSHISMLMMSILASYTKYDRHFSATRFASSWRMDVLKADIEKYPADPYLAALYLFLSDHKPDTDAVLVDYNIPSRTFAYPDMAFLKKLLVVRRNDILLSNNSNSIMLLAHNPQFSELVTKVTSHLQFLQGLKRSYSTGSDQRKRRKLDLEETDANGTLDVLVHSAVTVEIPLPLNTKELASSLKVTGQIGQGLFQSLLVDYDNLQLASAFMSDILPDGLEHILTDSAIDSAKVKHLSFFMLLLQSDGDVGITLDEWLTDALLERSSSGFQLTGSNSKSKQELLEGLNCYAQLTDLDLTFTRTLFFDESTNMDKSLNLAPIFSHLPASAIPDFNNGVFGISQLDTADTFTYITTLDALLDLFTNWSELQTPNYKAMNDVFSKVIYASASRFSRDVEAAADQILEKLVFVRFLRFLADAPPRKVNPATLCLPPELAYSLFFSANPILLNAVCRQVVATKTYYNETATQVLSDEDITYEIQPHQLNALREIHYSYVMDYCNVIWRNKAFHRASQGQSAKGFLLGGEFTETLLKRRFHVHGDDFADDDDRIVDEAGERSEFNIFHSPPFANIITKIIRQKEDDSASCEVRLAGPFTVKQFTRLRDAGNWLGDEFPDETGFESAILKQLGDSGYEGIVSLLVSSLKSLFNR